jgi:rhamnogalacturonyl hydrolase YesR
VKIFQPLLLSLVLLGGLGLRAAVAPLPPLQTAELADRVLNKGLAEIDLGLYPGTLLLQGMSELSANRADPELLQRTVALYKKFATKEIKGRGSFISYEVGGSGAAFLRQRGLTHELDAQVAEAAKRMVETQKRSGEGLLVPPWAVAEKDQVFIDIAFAVTPYLLHVGLAEKNDTYIELAAFETLELFRILRDSSTGLLRQGRGFQGKNVISEDNWSRGNGWGAVGLAALVRDLPAAHPKRKEVEALAKDFFTAVLRYQNQDGLWHQEMTDPSSYTEVSGSGLLLYGLGVMLERGVLARDYEANFIKGLSALPAYIAADGSVSHACIGCLCPGQGTKADYKARLWAYNDPHAFGPVVLAYAQAEKLGIRQLTPRLKPGCFASPEDAPAKPRTYVRYNPDGGQNVGWENDRIAFRVYGPSVRNRVGSGIDIWAKSVEYPIIDKWYRLNAAGHEYHIDRGEGCDFYDVGKLRGCGGSALWRNGWAFPAETYATQSIIANTSRCPPCTETL